MYEFAFSAEKGSSYAPRTRPTAIYSSSSGLLQHNGAPRSAGSSRSDYHVVLLPEREGESCSPAKGVPDTAENRTHPKILEMRNNSRGARPDQTRQREEKNNNEVLGSHTKFSIFMGHVFRLCPLRKVKKEL